MLPDEIRSKIEDALEEREDTDFFEVLTGPHDELMGIAMIVPSLKATAMVAYQFGFGEAHTHPKVEHIWALWVARKEPKPLVDRKFKVEDYDPEVVRLCEVLGELVEANGYKVLNCKNKAWLDAMKKTLNRAKEVGATPDKVEALMKWATADEFWRLNVRSATKFYAQYDRLRETANNASRSRPEKVTPKRKSVWD